MVIDLVSAESNYSEAFWSSLLLQVVVSGILFIVVIGLILYFFSKYKSERDVNRTLPSEKKIEVTIIVGATLLLILIFALSIQPTVDYTNPDVGTINSEQTIDVTARQFFWTFNFNNTMTFSEVTNRSDIRQTENAVLNEGNNRMYIPLFLRVGVTYKFRITSNDVIHSFFVPDLLVKADAVPGSINTLYLTVEKPGSYWGTCAELCGASHSTMQFLIKTTNTG